MHTTKTMAMALAALVSSGCLLGHEIHDLPVTVGTGVNPTLTWNGEPASSIEVDEEIADGGSATVWSIFGPQTGDPKQDDVIPSGIAVGAELPPGTQQYHPATNSWDTTFEHVSLEPGHHYTIVVNRTHGPTDFDAAYVDYTP